MLDLDNNLGIARLEDDDGRDAAHDVVEVHWRHVLRLFAGLGENWRTTLDCNPYTWPRCGASTEEKTKAA